jgi:gluconolactonase
VPETLMDAPRAEIPIERFEMFATGLDHPECVAFDREGYLWAGGEAGQVYRVDRAGKVETVTTMGGFCGGLAFSPADELFVCNPSLGVVRVERSGRWDVFAASAGDHKLVCPNYPAFDSRGNLYVSDSGNWKKRNGCLVRFAPDGRGVVVGGPYGYANGLALSADERHLFMVESDTNCVLCFDLAADGSLGAAEIYAENVGRLPDGLALDVEGNLYVSCYASDDIHRIAPTRKRFLFAFDPYAILLSRPTNMAFGGDDFDLMYVANLGRTTITRARVGRAGHRPVNLRCAGRP